MGGRAGGRGGERRAKMVELRAVEWACMKAAMKAASMACHWAGRRVFPRAELTAAWKVVQKVARTGASMAVSMGD